MATQPLLMSGNVEENPEPGGDSECVMMEVKIVVMEDTGWPEWYSLRIYFIAVYLTLSAKCWYYDHALGM